MGSWHCAGMCGPFGVFLQKSSNQKTSKLFYHLGRLTTYLLLVFFFHKLTQPLRSILGSWVFLLFLVLWLILIISEWRPNTQKWTHFLIRFNKLFNSNETLNAYVLGVTTTLLPCFWLYGFVIMASEQQSIANGLSLILVFWIGTIPALFGVHVFLRKINLKALHYSRKVSALFVLIMAIVFWVTHNKPWVSASSTGT